MNNDSEILGEYADQGYFLLRYGDQIAVRYKDNGGKELVSINEDLAVPEILQDICRRHKATLVEEVAK